MLQAFDADLPWSRSAAVAALVAGSMLWALVFELPRRGAGDAGGVSAKDAALGGAGLALVAPLAAACVDHRADAAVAAIGRCVGGLASCARLRSARCSSR
jgi:hypothetical protein